MRAPRQFSEGWPEVESQVVIDAVRSVVSDPTSRPASERLLSEAGRRWADAHRSGTVMRARLEALGALLETEDEPARSDYLAALRLVADAATWTSLDHLEREALVDPLTGAGNRRALDMTLEGAAGAALRLGFGLVVVAIDLDGLKRINDESGHLAGDRALIALVDALAGSVRASDTVFRTGGDEFVLVLQGTILTETEPLLQRIAATGAPSFSWGAAALTPDLRSAEGLVAAADDDLYRRRGTARRSGFARPVPDGSEAALDGSGTSEPSPADVAVTVVSLTAGDRSVLARLTSRRRPQPIPRSQRRRAWGAMAAIVLVGGVAAAVTGLTPLHPRSASTTPMTGAGGAGPTGTPITVPGPAAASPTTATPPAGAVTVARAAVPVGVPGAPPIGRGVAVAPSGAVTASSAGASDGPTVPAVSPPTVPVGGPPVALGSSAPLAAPPATPSTPTTAAPTPSPLGTAVSGLVGAVDGVAGTVGQVIDGVLGIVPGIAPAP